MNKEEAFYMVKRLGPFSPTRVHGSWEEARKEAERLAKENPGVRFYVLEAIEFSVCDAPVRSHTTDRVLRPPF